MDLGPDDIAYIAHLARLRIEDDDVAVYARELTRILHLVEKMQAVDTAGVEPMAHPVESEQRLRPDRVTESNQREHFQATAPAVADGLYLVPKVIE